MIRPPRTSDVHAARNLSGHGIPVTAEIHAPIRNPTGDPSAGRADNPKPDPHLIIGIVPMFTADQLAGP